MSSRGKRFSARRKPNKCPRCGAKTVARILWGFPYLTEALEKDMEAGRVVLGGCCVSDDDPTWSCTTCGAEIHKERPEGTIGGE